MIRAACPDDMAQLKRAFPDSACGVYPAGYLEGLPFIDAYLRAYLTCDGSAAVVQARGAAHFGGRAPDDPAELAAFFETLDVGEVFVPSAAADGLLPAWQCCEKTVLELSRLSGVPTGEAAVCADDDRRVWQMLLDVNGAMPPYRDYRQGKLLSSGYLGGMTAGVFDGEICAASAGVILTTSTRALLGAVATRPEYRRRGLAGALVTLLSGKMLERGLTPVLMCSNPAALRLYAALGFEECGRVTVFERP